MQAADSHASAHINPRPKMGSGLSPGMVTPKASTQRSREPSRRRRESARPNGDTKEVEDEAVKCTDALVRRVLCPLAQAGLSEARPLDELLPPLTSSNEVDLQLYAIIAIVMRDFVYSWYARITPDQSFGEEVIRIIAHCTRELEQRFRRVDVESLVLDEIPALIEEHISGTWKVVFASHQLISCPAYRTAHPARESAMASSPKAIYHTIVPHPALSPAPVNDVPTVEQLRNEAAYRQLLVQGVLAVLLPTEDLRNPCLRTLVADVMADTILGNGIGGKASEGWLLYDGIIKLVENGKSKAETTARGAGPGTDTRSRLEGFGLVPPKEGDRDGSNNVIRVGIWSTLSDAFWRIAQYCYITLVAIRFFLLGLFAAASAPPRDRSATDNRMMNKSHYVALPIAASVEAPSSAAGQRPVLTFSILGLVSQLLELPCRMPWTYGLFSLVQWHLVSGVLLQVGATNGILDK